MSAAQFAFEWGLIPQYMAEHLLVVGAALGLGGGAGIVTFLHYCPAPYEDQQWLGAIFDSLQDRAKNMGRVGSRRQREPKGGAPDVGDTAPKP